MMSHHQQVFFLFLVLQYKYSKAFSVLLAQFIRIFSVFHFSFYSKIYIFSSIFFLEVFLERNCFESEIIITTKIFSIKQDVSAYTFSLLLFFIGKKFDCLYPLLCALSLEDVGDHGSPPLPVVCNPQQCLSFGYLSKSLFCESCRSLLGRLFAPFLCPSCLQQVL